MVLGEVVYAHVSDDVATDEKVDVRKLDAVGRLSGSYYSSIRDRFSMERPP
jgi:flavin reductase (DIM6/NTAB) family NADH-FMN oxidoreductase RutF